MRQRNDKWKKAAKSASYDYRNLVEKQKAAQDEAESLVLLPHVQQKRLDAVNNATGMMAKAYSVKGVEFVEAVYFERTRTVPGAAMLVGISVDEARKWDYEYLKAVWSGLCGYGLRGRSKR